MEFLTQICSDPDELDATASGLALTGQAGNAVRSGSAYNAARECMDADIIAGGLLFWASVQIVLAFVGHGVFGVKQF